MTRTFKMLIKKSINRFRLFHSTIVFAKPAIVTDENERESEAEFIRIKLMLIIMLPVVSLRFFKII